MVDGIGLGFLVELVAYTWGSEEVEVTEYGPSRDLQFASEGFGIESAAGAEQSDQF